ncbi:ATP synthase subunit O, mitochondrial, partial [Eschrichtius robustus]|nr:ATP synthase subunit O, mitochondrial [Eschrichtius robustus]
MAASAVSRLSLQARCFSTSVVRPFAKLVRPPVQVYGIEGRYATALYSAASKQNKLEQVEKELLRVAQIVKEPKMAASIMNPYVKRSIKMKSLNDITAKEKFSPLTSNLINLLAENGRLNNTAGVISAFSTMMSAHRGEVPCTVATASTLKVVPESTLARHRQLLLPRFLQLLQHVGQRLLLCPRVPRQPGDRAAQKSSKEGRVVLICLTRTSTYSVCILTCHLSPR